LLTRLFWRWADSFCFWVLILIIWNRREKARYYDSILLTRRDIKESFTRDPERPWLGAWQVGGKISLVVGIVILIIAGILWLTG